MPPTLASLSGGALASSLAGGPEEAADLRRSFVLRKGQLLPVDFQRLLRHGDMSQNIYLQADDFIYLPSAISRDVYVLGAVAQAKAVNAARPLTLISAIASAGGTIKDAYLSHVAIVRGSLAQPQISVLDYKAIARGKLPDALLEPGDIVYVPFTPYQVLTRYVNLILDTFVRTVGANAGSRVVTSQATVGVNVPIGTTSTPP